MIALVLPRYSSQASPSREIVSPSSGGTLTATTGDARASTTGLPTVPSRSVDPRMPNRTPEVGCLTAE